MIPITAKYIQDYFWTHRNSKKKHTLATIELVVCEHFGLNVDDMYRRTRVRHIVECRYVIWWYLRKKNMTLHAIKEHYIMNNHTSVSHGVSKINDLLSSDEQMKSNIAAINHKLSQHG